MSTYFLTLLYIALTAPERTDSQSMLQGGTDSQSMLHSRLNRHMLQGGTDSQSMLHKEAQTHSLCYKEAQTHSLCYKGGTDSQSMLPTQGGTDSQSMLSCYNFNQKWYKHLQHRKTAVF